MKAEYANLDHSSIILTDDAGTRWVVGADDKRLQGLAIEPYEDMAVRVASVRPLAFRKAARLAPSPVAGHPHLLAYILAMLPRMGEEAQEEFDFMTEARRSDLVRYAAILDIPEAAVDSLLTTAASLPDSGAIYESI